MPPKKKSTSKELLVIEDDPLIKDYLEDMLKTLRYKVTCCDTGFQALKKASERRFDLILLDVMLPDMDGITLCRQLHSEENTNKTPIMMMTCLSDSKTVNDAYAHGAVDFIAKPFDQASLKSKIKNILLKQPMPHS